MVHLLRGLESFQVTASMPQAPSDESSSTRSDVAAVLISERLLRHSGALLALSVIVVYGLALMALVGFYGSFGLTPEDVGLTEAVIVGRAGLAFAVVFSAATIPAGLITLVVAWALGRWRIRRSPTSYDRASDQRSRVLWGVLTALAIATLYIGLRSFRPAASETIRSVRMAELVALIALSTLVGILAATQQRRERSSSPAHGGAPPESRLLIAIICSLVVAAVMFGAFLDGATYAGEAKRGHDVYSGYALGIRATPVCLVVEAEPVHPQGPYMYLGQSQGLLVLLDYLRTVQNQSGRTDVAPVVDGKPIWIPSAGVTIRAASESTTEMRPTADGPRSFEVWHCEH
jgi:hypothetical protein